MPICIHCEHYEKIPERLRTVLVLSTNKKEYKRYCRHVEHDVSGESTSCKSFIPYQYFWCDRFTYKLHLLQCLNRQKKQMELCRRCNQAENILDCARGRDLYQFFGVNRKIHLIRKKSKATLRRRKA